MTIPLIRMRYITIVKTKTVTVSPPLTKKVTRLFFKWFAYKSTTKQQDMNEKWVKVTMRMSISDLIIQFIHKITVDVSFQTSLGCETKYRFHRRVNHPVVSMDRP